MTSHVTQRNTRTNRLMADEPRFLTKEQLREKLNLPSLRAVDELIKRKRVPVVRMGHRTVRFDWNKIEQAIERLTTKEAGR